MKPCPYANKGCSKSMDCDHKIDGCGMAKYFDFIVGNSRECKENALTKDQFVDMWKKRQQVVEQCMGCSKVTKTGFCKTFVIPANRWPEGDVYLDNKCFLADHVKLVKRGGKLINPLKASRRASRRG